MKNKLNLLYVMLATILLLAACGTSNSVNGQTENKKDDPINDVEQDENGTLNESDTEEEIEKDIEVEIEKDTAEDNKEVTNNTENEKTVDNPSTENEEIPDPTIKEEVEDVKQSETIVLSYNDGENNKSKEAELTDSDEQDYSVYVLPLYKLTSEEPGRDSLYFNDDTGSIFMRIETMVTEDGTYDYALENTLVLLEASGDSEAPKEITDIASLPSGENIKNAKGYIVNTETGPVSGFVFEKQGIVVKLTIFDSPESKHFEAFLRMAETIQGK